MMCLSIQILIWQSDSIFHHFKFPQKGPLIKEQLSNILQKSAKCCQKSTKKPSTNNLTDRCRMETLARKEEFWQEVVNRSPGPKNELFTLRKFRRPMFTTLWLGFCLFACLCFVSRLFLIDVISGMFFFVSAYPRVVFTAFCFLEVCFLIDLFLGGFWESFWSFLQPKSDKREANGVQMVVKTAIDTPKGRQTATRGYPKSSQWGAPEEGLGKQVTKNTLHPGKESSSGGHFGVQKRLKIHPRFV